MHPRFTHVILVLLILALTVSVFVPAVPAAGTTRAAPGFAPATATPAPVETVTCAAPCQCLAYAGAVSLWGGDGFSQCAELPCEVSSSVTGAPVELHCYKQKQQAVPTTTTPAQVLIPRGRITTIPTTVMQVLIPRNLTTTTPVPVQHPAVVPVNPSVRQVNAPLDLCHYDPAKDQCAGICPQTGKACMQISGSSCGDTTGMAIVKCGCVDTKSPASVAAAGLGRAVIVAQADYRSYSPPPKGAVDSTIQLITGLVKRKPDLSTADPKQYTMETTRFATAQFPGVCPEDLFRTTLIFADDDTAYISTETGSQKGSFSWDSADPRVRSAVWQVSVLPFPMSRDNWSNVPGLLAQGNLEGDERTFTIDFSKSVPTAAGTASVWVNRNTFLVVQKKALARVRADLAAGPADIAGINTAISAADHQKLISGLDNALVKIDTRIAAPAAYTMASGLTTGTVTPVTKDLANSAAPGVQLVDHSGKYLAKDGVFAPSLNVPALSKAGITGSLPQNQRTLFVRVVPFDQNGNYTNNPSNTREVVIGSPRFNVTSPWSGWTVQPEPDQSGFANPPELVRFGNRLYQFNVRSDHLVSMSSVSDAGAVTGWTQVPGAPQTDKVISAVEYRRVLAGRESSESHIYLFVTRQDTGHTWYSRMDTSGAWSVWKQVPQKDPKFTSTTGYHYTLEKALILNGNLYLLAEYNYDYNHPDDMSFSHPSLSFMYQRMNDDQNEKWMDDWVDTSVGTSGNKGKIAGATSQFIVGAYQDGADQPHFTVSYPPRCADLCDAPYPKIVMDKLTTINIPPEILNAKTGAEDLTATSYHGRLYFFVRGKNSHIYMNWATIMNQLGSTQHFGSLHEWEDISPGRMALGSGITSLPSMEGDRLDVYANDIQSAAQGSGGSGLFAYFFAPQSTGLHRNSLGGAPENTQVLASFSGEKVKQTGDIAMTGYGSRDINISWSRPTPFWFAWNSSRSDLYYAEWQVSSAPFDEVNPKFDDKGIISRGRLSVSDTDPDLATYGSGYFNANALPEYTDKVHLFPVNFPGFGTVPDPNNPTVTPYYLRVLAVAPATGPGSFTAYASEQTEVDWGKQDEFVPKFCTPPAFYTYEYRLPQVRITGYTPIDPREADADCHVIATTGHTYWKEQYLKNPVPAMLVGQATNDVNKDADAFATLMVGNVDYGWTKNICTPPDDKNWWEKIIEGFKDLFALIASLVNNIADAYNGTKQILIASICANDPACQTIVSAGVDIGLAALGVPPTLPNFDKLMDEGADYMAATLAEESGIPGSEIALKAGMHEMADSMKNVPSPHDAYGIQPDPEFQYRPARLSIELRNNDPVNTTPPGSFRFEDDWGLFKTTQPDTPFPSLAPGEVLTFPLILREDQWKGVTCTERLAGGSETWTVPCDESYPGQINKGWWEKYQQAADGGDSFTLYYDGMSANFTKSITGQMEAQYGVPLDTYKGDGWQQDYKSPDCFAEKHQLVFRATDNAGNKISYDPINRVYVDSLSLEWKA